MKLVCTQDINQSVELSEALLKPSGNYGGLFTIENLPKLDDDFFKENLDSSYQDLAINIIKKFNFDISDEIFIKALKRYESFDDPNLPLNFTKLDEKTYINELYHGPTRAFKDMALQPFGEILSSLSQKDEKDFLIITATSGDTGPATLKTFQNCKNVKVVCLYPDGGTSEIQKLQMLSLNKDNLKVITIKGNFDDAQRSLKTLLASQSFKDELSKKNLKLSSANSVNFGRILFQIIYYIYSYIYLLKNEIINETQSFDISVPSGNFGNALAGYFAKKMGAKIAKIHIISNENNILTQLFNTGVYDLRDKKLINTISPAMDILVSSNIERLLFDKFKDKRTKELMSSLKNKKFYKLSSDELKALQEDFDAIYCNDEECKSFIKQIAQKGILLDPHTANCLKSKSERLNLIISTAQWVKFTPSISKSLNKFENLEEFEAMKEIAKEFKEEIPKQILDLYDLKDLSLAPITTDEIEKNILDWIKK